MSVVENTQMTSELLLDVTNGSDEIMHSGMHNVQPDANVDISGFSFSLIDCIAATVHETSDTIRNKVVEVLKSHRKQFQLILMLLHGDEHTNYDNTDEKERLKLQDEAYDNVISQCDDNVITDNKNLAVYIYASATSLNLSIYIFCEDEFGNYNWEFYPPLFEFESQPEPQDLTYVTMRMTPAGNFIRVKTETVPKAVGVVGKFLKTLEETKLDDIEVPMQLLHLPNERKEEMIRRGNMEMLKQACHTSGNTATFNGDEIAGDNEGRDTEIVTSSEEDISDILLRSKEAFATYCRVLIKCRNFLVLAVGITDWDAFVTECKYIDRFMKLSELDQVIVERNIEVGMLVNSCKDGGAELDRRRKTVTTTVIASSSVGIVSSGLTITGLALAPFSFGASLALAVVGGTIGVVAGVTAGSVRTVEAVKQNAKVKDIIEKQAVVEEKEAAISKLLTAFEDLLENETPRLSNAQQEGPGISRRGFMAVGSAARSFHSGVSIALAAVRLSASAASVSAAVLGPLSLVIDIAFLADAAHNKRKGDKTNAGKKLQEIAETVDVKHRIFNAMLRGNSADWERLVITEAS